MNNLRNDIIFYLEPALGKCRVSGQQIKFDCPNCGTAGIRKYNLEVNSIKYVFKCWACHYKGHLKFLLKDYAKDNSWTSIKELWDNRVVNYEEHAETQEKELPRSIPYYLSEEASFYLKEIRNLHDIVLQSRRVMYCYSKEDQYYNKIIFPFYENNKFIGFSTHDLTTKKYSNQRSLNFVPYKDLININYPIIVTEGVYDALSIPNAIPLLGTKPSNELYKFAKDKKIILCLDNEVPMEEKMEIANKFRFYDAKAVLIFDIKDYKDVNEYRVKDQEGLKEEIKNIFKLLV